MDINKLKKYCEKEIKKLDGTIDNFEKGLIHAYNNIINKLNSNKIKKGDINNNE